MIVASHMRRFSGAVGEAFDPAGFAEAFGAAFDPVGFGKAFARGWREAIDILLAAAGRLITRPIGGRFVRLGGLQRSLLQKLHEANPRLQASLETGIAVLTLAFGVFSILQPRVDYLSALFGFGIGAPLAGGVIARAVVQSPTAKASVGYWQLELTALAFVGGGVGSIMSAGFDSAFVELASGLPAALGIPLFGSSATRRQLLSYCYGAFLGPLVCYQFAIRWCLPALGWDVSSLKGYAMALIVGVILSVEMPITYWIDKSSMMPLTFATGIITGFAMMSALFALSLLLLFGWPGGIVALLIIVIIFHALRPV